VECGCIPTDEYKQAVVDTISRSCIAELLEGFRQHLDRDRVDRGKVDKQQEVVAWLVAAEVVVAMADTRRVYIFLPLAS
jgi:hypothetical protein